MQKNNAGMGLADNKKGNTKMTLNELISGLQELQDSFEGDPEVKVAQQPTWPLAADLRALTRIGDTLWIATEEDGGYAPEKAWEGGEFDSAVEDDDED